MSDESSNDTLASGNSGKSGLPSSLNEINSRIMEASKDSRFTAAQERKSAELEIKVKLQREQLNRALEQPQLISRAKKAVDAILKSFEEEQKENFALAAESCWVCVDMDAFFAAVECLDAPELRNVPMAVGSSAMLSTSNYEARKFGVSAAMPGYIAMKLCPELQIVPLRYERYRELSALVTRVLLQYDPDLSMWSLDEAVLRLSKDLLLEGESFADVVQRMRKQVFQETGLTCSAGIACNPLLAKLASNYQKPDGQFEIERARVDAMKKFLYEQPVRKLSGIGKVMTLTLEKVFNVRTIGDLYNVRYQLPLIFKEKTLKSLLAKSIGHAQQGCDDHPFFESSDVQKSLSCERTFQLPTSSLEFFQKLLKEELVVKIYEDLCEMGIGEIGRVGIKVKTSDFRVFTRERQMKIRIGDGFKDKLFFCSEKILKEFIEENGGQVEVRLLGIRLSNMNTGSNGVKKRPAVDSHELPVLDNWIKGGSRIENKEANESIDSAMKCPICNRVIKNCTDLKGINDHIDECLTKETVKDIVSTSFIK